jgi:hypothetical protein
MLHASISSLAWIIVVLIQAIVHFWICKGSRRRDDIDRANPWNEKTNACIDDEETLKRRRSGSGKSDDCVPPMVPHAQISEDEYEEEPEQETFDGDEPKLFFELLDKTGSEMMEVRFFKKSLYFDFLIQLLI